MFQEMADALVDELQRLFRQNALLSGAAVILFLFSLFFYSHLHILLIPWSVLLGIITCYIVFDHTPVLPNLLPIFVRKRKQGVKKALEAEVSDSCPVCGDKHCFRHRQLNPKNNQPWMDIIIPERVDKALSKLFEYVLKDFVYELWYKELSSNEEFVTQLRMTIRHIMAVFFKRVCHVDIPSLIIDKLVKAGMSHLDVYLRAKRKLTHGQDIQTATIRELGPHLHIAARNRLTELEYLQHLCKLLLPIVLPQKTLNSEGSKVFLREIVACKVFLPAMDVVSDPDVVNLLLYLFFDPEAMVPSTEPPTKQVSMLQSFCDENVSTRESALHFKAEEIMNNRDLLFPFIQFMRKEGSLNILQFCLTVEDFNKRSLIPELTDAAKMKLHSEAKELYRLYFAANAVDRIQFDDDIIAEVKDIAEGNFQEVSRLRTSSALFRAYEHAFSLLENTFCPMFHHSDEFFTIHCGSRPENKVPVYTRMLVKKPDTLAAMHKLSSRIRGVFKSQAIDEVPGYPLGYSDSESAPQSNSEAESELEDDESGMSSPQHDLSAWRISIPRVESRQEAGRELFIFRIHIKRIDINTNSEERSEWEVERMFHEFYVLENKLSEFHGGFDFEDSQLPPKRSFLVIAKNIEFMEKKRPAFEKYLQILLTKPFLRGSQLLYRFLTSEEEFATKFLPDVNLGKIMKSVSTKVIKERGQHLEPFLQSFLSSVEEPKPKPGDPTEDANPEKIIKDMVSDPVHGNNACQMFDRSTVEMPGQRSSGDLQEVNGIFDYILYIARSVFEISSGMHHILFLIRKVAKNTLETFLDHYLSYKMDLVASEVEMEKLITLLTEVLFIDDDPPRTDTEKQTRKDEAFKQMIDFFPDILGKILGEENFIAGFKVIFDGLQCPKLNKHLAYILLDIVAQELFPELADDKMGESFTVYDEDHYKN
ncbi:sorting nexin-14-like isoform X2 [Apostichopus japonicus]|uniref:sorting nexin-14-like isoform X2 n=1 Tax=Stichopus japonicus TaxID=307972 RepID=UPI003AB3DEA4